MLTNDSDIIIGSQAIRDEIAKAEYDVYLLTELWMRNDHEIIAAALPEVAIFVMAYESNQHPHGNHDDARHQQQQLHYYCKDDHDDAHQGYHMTAYDDYGRWYSDGRISPAFCSGLAIVSRYDILNN